MQKLKSKKLLQVLLIEDNPADALLIRELVSSENDSSFEIFQSVENLSHGLQIIDSQKIDLVLLDLSLPDSSGMKTFKRARDHAPHLPVIILSGSDDDKLSLETLHEGAQDFLVKGRFDRHLLLRAMRYACQRQMIEETLANERNLLKSLVDNIPDSIYAKDIEGRYVIDNVSHFRRLRMEKSGDVIGKTVFDLFPREIAVDYHAYDQAIMLSGKPLLNHVEPGISPDGSPGWVSTTKVPLHDPAGNITGLVCVTRDITEQKRAQDGLLEANEALARSREELLHTLDDLKKTHEELRSVQLQLIEAEKMKSIGRLAAGVAHEVKNPLAIISMGIEYLSRGTFSGDSDIPGVLAEISGAVKRADLVIRGLLDFSAPKQLDMDEVDLNAIIGQALLLVRGEMQGEKFEIVKQLGEDIPPLRLDGIKIGQVFINVFTNAIHSMNSGGTLSVRTYARQLTSVGPNLGDGRSGSFRVGDTVVAAEIDDTGPGVPEDKLRKVFEPFFTTKPTGKGTGLGLTVSKTIIDLHGGTMDIQNRPEGGARVTITFRV